MRVALTPEELRVLAKPNERTWTAEEVKPMVNAWGPWFQVSGVLQMFHAPCLRSGLALRLFVPAAAMPVLGKDTAWTQEVQKVVDAHIKAGYIMIEEKELLTTPEGHTGTLFLDLNVILNTPDATHMTAAHYLIPIFAKCAKCHTLMKPHGPVPACSRCGLVYYCNENCENAHRPWHERVCGVKKETK